MARLAALPSQEMKVVGLVSFGHMLSHFYFFVLPPLLPVLQAEFEVSYALLALPMASFAIAAATTSRSAWSAHSATRAARPRRSIAADDCPGRTSPPLTRAAGRTEKRAVP